MDSPHLLIAEGQTTGIYVLFEGVISPSFLAVKNQTNSSTIT